MRHFAQRASHCALARRSTSPSRPSSSRTRATSESDQVEARGQFALRGGILDVFGATEDRAARLELFGDEIESIRWFSTFTQRSLGRRAGARALACCRARVRAPHARRGRPRGLGRRRGRGRPDRLPAGRFLPRAARLDLGRRRLRHRRRRGDRVGPSLALGGRHGRHALRRRPASLRRRSGALGRARGASPALDRAGRGQASRSAHRPRPQPPARSRRPSRSSSARYARATASSSPSTTAAKPSARATTCSGSTPRSWEPSFHPKHPFSLLKRTSETASSRRR